MNQLLFFLLIATGCATDKSNDKKKDMREPNQVGEFGHLKEEQIKFSLAMLPNGTNIKICGPQTNRIIQAIETWGKALGRQYIFENSCDNPTIRSYGYNDPATLKYKLDASVLAFTMVVGTPLEIFNNQPEEMSKATVLHEVGHLMGLCDQYIGGIRKCAKTTKPVQKSVMGSTSTYTELQNDDIEGIRYLAGMLNQTSNLKSKDLRFLTQDEIEEFNELGNDPDKGWIFCRSYRTQPFCEEYKCIWDFKSGCLSPLVSFCTNASTEKTCEQIWGCAWSKNACVQALMI